MMSQRQSLNNFITGNEVPFHMAWQTSLRAGERCLYLNDSGVLRDCHLSSSDIHMNDPDNYTTHHEQSKSLTRYLLIKEQLL